MSDSALGRKGRDRVPLSRPPSKKHCPLKNIAGPGNCSQGGKQGINTLFSLSSFFWTLRGLLIGMDIWWMWTISFSNAWKWKVKVKSLSRFWLLATPWTGAYQAPPSMGFSRQEYWSQVPLPSSEEISSLSHCIVFLYFFALIAKEGFLISSCYSLELCIQMGMSFLSPLLFASLLFTAICKASSDSCFAYFAFLFLGDSLDPCLLYNVTNFWNQYNILKN